jgi:ABC-type antimicrobial peptide transport system permease subunit
METDPNAAAFHAMALAEYTQLATLGQKVAANLMAALGLMCLLLAAMGLYSVMSYTVSQRIPEIGIRMAMGARPWNVISMVVRQGMALALAGMAVGTVAALAVTRLVATLLFHVDAADPLTFMLAAGFLGAVALVATWLPAFRATRIDPMPALRR